MDLTLLAVVGNTLLGKAISDAYVLCKSSYNPEHSIDYRQLQSCLLEMDVFATLESTGSLLNMLKRQHNLNSYETGVLLVEQIEETMLVLQTTLLNVSRQVEIDKARWLSAVRPTFNYSKYVQMLKSNLKILDSRLQQLLRLIPLLKDENMIAEGKLKCLDLDSIDKPILKAKEKTM